MQLANIELHPRHTRTSQLNSESKEYFIAVILKPLILEDHSTLDMEIPLDISLLQSTHFTSVGIKAQRDSMFEKDQKSEIRKLNLGPKSLVSTFNVVLLLTTSYSNIIMCLENLFTKLKMNKKKPIFCQSYS